MKKIIMNVLVVLSAAILIWVGVSFVDIVNDNNSITPSHNDYNFFEVMAD